eukprot:3076479-Amphidinium_carterae.1
MFSIRYLTFNFLSSFLDIQYVLLVLFFKVALERVAAQWRSSCLMMSRSLGFWTYPLQILASLASSVTMEHLCNKQHQQPRWHGFLHLGCSEQRLILLNSLQQHRHPNGTIDLLSRLLTLLP